MVLENIGYFAGLNQYLRASTVFFVLLLALRILLFIVTKVFIKISSRTKTDIDDLLLKKTSAPLTYIALLVSLLVALQEIVLVEVVQNYVFRSIYSLLTVSGGYLIFVAIDITLVRIWKKFAEKTESDIDDSIGQLVHEVLRIVLIIIVVIFILNFWGIDVGPLLAGLGIAGLAVALALQPVLSNIFSGISLVLDGTFKVGDVIELENGKVGEVYRIGLRTTRIKSFDNEMIIIPNSQISNSALKNFFQPDISIRVNVEFGVEYGVDPEYVKKLIISEVEKMDIIDKEQEVRILFTEMANSSLNFKVMFWVDHIKKKWPAHQEAMTRIYRKLYDEGIGIPYPQRTVWMRDEKHVKSPDPKDKKFNSVKDKYYASFGHEYVPEVDEGKRIGKSDEKKEGKSSIKEKDKEKGKKGRDK